MLPTKEQVIQRQQEKKQVKMELKKLTKSEGYY